MKQDFEKWHGCSNDFILVWLDSENRVLEESLTRQASSLCSRNGKGIGADGLILLHHNPRNPTVVERLSIINSDGSEAKTCGNGIRCAAASVYERYRSYGKEQEIEDAVEFAVSNQQVICQFIRPRFICTEMGQPVINEDLSWYEDAKSEVTRISSQLKLPQLNDDFNACEIGNAHLVFFLEDVSEELIRGVGPAFQDSQFWDGINVHIVAPKELTPADVSKTANLLSSNIEDLYEAYVWERGAGMTQACGSGACAIAACAFDSGLVDRNQWLGVDMPGGRLFVKQDHDEDPMRLAGECELVFCGSVDI